MVNVIKKSKGWNCKKSEINNIVSLIFQDLNIKKYDFSIVLADDEFIKDYNKRFRNQDKATNVLSFAEKNGNYIGDIIISITTLKKEAQEQNKNFDDHFTHILIHGILHLLGYDHIKNDERKIMENLEISILSKLNISNPYFLN